MMTAEEMPKMRPLPVTKRGERRRWEILEEWEFSKMGVYNIYIIPKGFIFDGASIPRLFWNMLSPTGYLFIAGLIHDYLYKYAGIWTRGVDEEGKAGEKFLENFDKAGADKIFQDVSNHISMGEKCWTWIAKKALDIGGFAAWNEHRGNERK